MLQNVVTGIRLMLDNSPLTICITSLLSQVDGRQEPIDGISGNSALPTMDKIF